MLVLALLAPALLLSWPPLAQAEVLDYVSLRERHPDAVCLDGSHAGYYWKPAEPGSAGTNTWLVYLESGEWCWDAASCASHCAERPDLCTSRLRNDKLELQGIFSNSSDQRDESLRFANKLFLSYCSCDAHMGNAAAFGLEFRGARVLRAVLADLVKLHGLGQGGAKTDRDMLLFGGGSAGARGAMVHLDFVPDMLGSSVADRVEVLGFLDSPYWLDLRPLPPVLDRLSDSLANQTEQVHKLNASHLDDNCVAAYPNEQWKCMMGEYRMPFVKTPYLMVAALHDGYQLWMDANLTDLQQASEAQLRWGEEFAIKTKRRLAQLATKGHAVFGFACNNHAETLFDLGFFSHSTETGETISDALHRFLSTAGGNAADTTLAWIDQCLSVDCGSGCHAGDCVGEHADDWGCSDLSIERAAAVPALRGRGPSR